MTWPPRIQQMPCTSHVYSNPNLLSKNFSNSSRSKERIAPRHSFHTSSNTNDIIPHQYHQQHQSLHPQQSQVNFINTSSLSHYNPQIQYNNPSQPLNVNNQLSYTSITTSTYATPPIEMLNIDNKYI